MIALNIILTTIDARYNHRDCPWCGSPTRDYWVQIDWGWGAYEHPDDCSNPECGWHATLSDVEYIENPDLVDISGDGEDLPF